MEQLLLYVYFKLNFNPPVMKRILFYNFFLLISLNICAQQSMNMNLLSTHSYSTNLSDIWGYATDNGEYALVGLYNGISVVNVSNPSSPSELGFFSGPSSMWRDIKTYGNYLYCINETGGGLQILNLAEVISGNSSPTYIENMSLDFTTAHNLYIDENGILYVFGSSYSNGGAMIFDLVPDPENPVFLGNYSGSYFHDGMVRGDTLWGGAIYNGQLSVVDVSDKANPVLMATQSTPNSFTHNCWISDDGNTVFTTDEVSGAYVTAYDVSDLNDIEELDRIQSWSSDTDVIPHNTHVDGDFIVTSYYTDGVSVVDASNPSNLIEVGYYDTSGGYSGGGFNGAWGAYPFLPSGIILVSDMENGLYVIEPKYGNASFIEGYVTNSVNGAPISNVTVQLVGSNDPAITVLNGFYETGIANEGTYDVFVSADGYSSQIVTVNMSPDAILQLDIELIPSGCMDEFACNYNPLAVTDDGSCAELDECGECGGDGPIPGYDCQGNCISGETLTVQMNDSYGDGWNGNNLVVNGISLTIETDSTGSETICYDSTAGCIDVSCDGGSWQSEVSWTISDVNGNVLLSGGAPYSGAFGGSDCGPAITGCTDALALNYNSAATEDDGSCEYPIDCEGLTTITVAMMDSYGDGWNGNVLTINNETFTLDSGSDGLGSICVDLSSGCIAVTCDGGTWQEEISWTISDENGNQLLNGGAPYTGEYCDSEQSCQTLDFPAGWSIFSTYIMTDDMGIVDVLLPLTTTDNLVIVKDVVGTAYLPDWDFDGIGVMDFKQGYLMKTNFSQSIELCGVHMLPEQHPIELQLGWSMFAYLRIEPADIEAVLEGIVNHIVIVKDAAGNAYLPDWEFNGIGDLESGKGYLIKMSSDQTLNYLSNDQEY